MNVILHLDEKVLLDGQGLCCKAVSSPNFISLSSCLHLRSQPFMLLVTGSTNSSGADKWLQARQIFVVNMFDDFDKYMKVPDEWVAPEVKPYTPGVWFFPCFDIEGSVLYESCQI
jgi:hypothetical protein